MAQLLAKRSALLQKKSDHEKKIRELGSLPAEAFEKYQGKSLAEVSKMLARAQKQLKKYGYGQIPCHLLTLTVNSRGAARCEGLPVRLHTDMALS